MGLLQRIFRPSAVKHVEGQYRDGPWALPVTGGWLPHEWGVNWNWWQLGYDPIGLGRSAMVQACISAYAQTIAMCPGSHWRRNPNSGRERVTTSALSRILRRPNGYQSPSDFLLNLVARLYEDGNAYALAIRNDRFEIAELHLMQSNVSGVNVAINGEAFYYLGGNELIEKRLADIGVEPDLLHFVPSRDVLHVRLETPRHPLRGETPLTSVALDRAASNAMIRQTIAFYDNQARPSGVLTTDQILTKEQVDTLRERWNEQSQGLNQGKTPILTAGLKFEAMTTAAKDTQFADILKMSDQNVALAYRVPLQILGVGGTPFASTEALMQSWYAQGLGFALNHVEQAFDQLFGLYGVPDEYTEFDTAVLLRSSFKERVEGYARGVQGGIFAPNEARAEFELAAADFGDEPRVQQQVVPLSFWGEEPEEAPLPALPAPSDEEPEGDDDAGDDQRDFAEIILAAARRHEERIVAT